jgi:hypothetical protein
MRSRFTTATGRPRDLETRSCHDRHRAGGGVHGRAEQYEASIGAVHPSDGSLPEGQTFHAAGPSAGGWTIVAIHASRESWERFRDGVLMPRMQEGIEGGFMAPPEETTFEVYD